jgi:hypothetical protein
VGGFFLYFSVFLTDACYTVPCLSSDFNVNVMRVSVSASVAAVIFGAVNVLLPLAGFYVLWRRCKSHTGGLLNGMVMLNALVSWLQCITWGEQYTNLLDLTSTDILMYGSMYTLNTQLRKDAMVVSILCGGLAGLHSILSLALLRMREYYCVDYYEGFRPRSVMRTFQQYHTVAVSDDLPDEPRGVDDEEAITSTYIEDE